MAHSLADLGTRQEVEDTVIRLFVATDARDWATLEGCFTEPLVLDMTSMVGGQPATLTPREVSAAWAQGFQPLDHVHHQVGNLQTSLSGDSATVKCHGVAFHHRANITEALKTRVFVGTYTFELQRREGRWRVSHLTFHLKFIDGNLALEKAN